MDSFAYAAFPHAVREDLVASHRAVWTWLAAPGTWWTGAQKLAIARLVREARAVRADPPWLREEAGTPPPGLSPAALDAVRRIAIDAQRLDRDWCAGAVAALDDAPYVELVAAVVCVTAVDAFAEALGAELEPLPEPVAGEPARTRPDGMGDGGAWLPMAVPWSGPNVGRALSLVPAANASFLGLVGAMYAMADFTRLVWEDRPLSRPQVELVAARVSAVNECFY